MFLKNLWRLTQTPQFLINLWCLTQTPHILKNLWCLTRTPQILKNLWCLAHTPQILVKFHRFWVDDVGGEWCFFLYRQLPWVEKIGCCQLLLVCCDGSIYRLLPNLHLAYLSTWGETIVRIVIWFLLFVVAIASCNYILYSEFSCLIYTAWSGLKKVETFYLKKLRIKKKYTLKEF